MDEDEEEAVPLPNVNAAILKKVWEDFKIEVAEKDTFLNEQPQSLAVINEFLERNYI